MSVLTSGSSLEWREDDVSVLTSGSSLEWREDRVSVITSGSSLQWREDWVSVITSDRRWNGENGCECSNFGIVAGMERMGCECSRSGRTRGIGAMRVEESSLDPRHHIWRVKIRQWAKSLRRRNETLGHQHDVTLSRN